jgi:hypothetical protein
MMSIPPFAPTATQSLEDAHDTARNSAGPFARVLDIDQDLPFHDSVKGHSKSSPPPQTPLMFPSMMLLPTAVHDEGDGQLTPVKKGSPTGATPVGEASADSTEPPGTGMSDEAWPSNPSTNEAERALDCHLPTRRQKLAPAQETALKL